jgi:hypothetical protein
MDGPSNGFAASGPNHHRQSHVEPPGQRLGVIVDRAVIGAAEFERIEHMEFGRERFSHCLPDLKPMQLVVQDMRAKPVFRLLDDRIV